MIKREGAIHHGWNPSFRAHGQWNKKKESRSRLYQILYLWTISAARTQKRVRKKNIISHHTIINHVSSPSTLCLYTAIHLFIHEYLYSYVLSSSSAIIRSTSQHLHDWRVFEIAVERVIVHKSSSCFGAWHRHWRARAVGVQALCRRSFSKATLGWQLHWGIQKVRIVIENHILFHFYVLILIKFVSLSCNLCWFKHLFLNA